MKMRDEGRFDSVTKAFSEGRTRRGMLAGLAGGLLAAVGVRDAAAGTSAIYTVCYRDVTLEVPEIAVDALLARGATKGDCGRVSDELCYRGVTLDEVPPVAARYLLRMGATEGPCGGDNGSGSSNPSGSTDNFKSFLASGGGPRGL